MSEDGEITITVERTETGTYRASVDGVPPERFATGEDPMVAVRGALAVARDAVDAAAEYERRPDPEVAGSE
jgi:hypothetical protein